MPGQQSASPFPLRPVGLMSVYHVLLLTVQVRGGLSSELGFTGCSSGPRKQSILGCLKKQVGESRQPFPYHMTSFLLVSKFLPSPSDCVQGLTASLYDTDDTDNPPHPFRSSSTSNHDSCISAFSNNAKYVLSQWHEGRHVAAGSKRSALPGCFHQHAPLFSSLAQLHRAFAGSLTRRKTV